jgi:hypothetical protein
LAVLRGNGKRYRGTKNIALVSGIGVLRTVEDRFSKGKFQHDLPLIIGDFQNGIEQASLPALRLQDFPDRCPRHVPRMIGIAKLFALRIKDQLSVDTGIEEISGHGESHRLAARRTAGQHVTSSLFGNSPARRSEVNTIFRETRWKPLIGHRFIFQR